VNALDWNKNILISGGGDGSVYGWDFRIKRNKEIFLYRTHNQGITAVKSNKIGNEIAVGGQDSNIIILDLRSS
jgi:WD40 repeat protein